MSSSTDRVSRFARPVAVVAATAAWVISAFVNDLSGWGLALTLAGGGGLTVLAVGLPMLVERRASTRAQTAEQIAEAAAARMQLVLDDAIEPLLYKIGQITDLPAWSRGQQLQTMRGEATFVVLAAAARVLGADRLRSCFFKKVGDDKLVPAGFHGRGEQPRSSFERGTPLGDAALTLLAQREDLFCADVDAGSPPGWRPSGHAYRTFLAVPVATEAREFGIMTIDGLKVGDLTLDDVAAARVFARLLAVGLNA